MLRITKKEREARAAEAIQYLSSPDAYNIRAGDTVYSTTAYVTASGMGAAYKFFTVKDGRIIPITWYIANATGTPLKDRDGERVAYVGGCGFNRPASVVMDLSQALFNDPYALKHTDL